MTENESSDGSKRGSGPGPGGYRGSGGGYNDVYEPEEILRVFASRGDPTEPLTTREISEANGRSRSATYKHAMKLAEAGVLRTKKTGMNSRVFWPSLDAGLHDGGVPHK